MTQEIRDFVPPSCELLGFGEPDHREPAFGWIRNELFASLVEGGFRSIALETDRVAALTVNDYVQEGVGTLDAAMTEGFSHGFGALEPNRELVAWMRSSNESRPPAERLAFHGFDTPTENPSAPSPRRLLEHARDYLGLDLDIASLVGDDERWSKDEAVMDPAQSPGATADAEQLRSIADDLLTTLYVRAPELIAATSRAEWRRARTHLTAGIGLLQYHKQAALPLERNARVTRLFATRDTFMARNLLEIRGLESSRGATFVFAHNRHLQRMPGTPEMADLALSWSSAASIVTAMSDERYTFVAGSLGSSAVLGLGEPEADTYEGILQREITTWGLTADTKLSSGRTRSGTPHGYIPLDRTVLDGADAILHISDGGKSA